MVTLPISWSHGKSSEKRSFDKIKITGRVIFSFLPHFFHRSLITETKWKMLKVWVGLVPQPLMLQLPLPLCLCVSELCPENTHLLFHVPSCVTFPSYYSIHVHDDHIHKTQGGICFTWRSVFHSHSTRKEARKKGQGVNNLSLKAKHSWRWCKGQDCFFHPHPETYH